MADGEKIYNMIHDPLSSNQNVILDFSGVKAVASPFLNAAIGQLLEWCDSDRLEKHLSYESLNTQRLKTIQRVIENAKAYYSDSNERDIIDQILLEESEERG